MSFLRFLNGGIYLIEQSEQSNSIKESMSGISIN